MKDTQEWNLTWTFEASVPIYGKMAGPLNFLVTWSNMHFNQPLFSNFMNIKYPLLIFCAIFGKGKNARVSPSYLGPLLILAVQNTILAVKWLLQKFSRKKHPFYERFWNFLPWKERLSVCFIFRSQLFEIFIFFYANRLRNGYGLAMTVFTKTKVEPWCSGYQFHATNSELRFYAGSDPPPGWK